jgi:hypothetical protein
VACYPVTLNQALTAESKKYLSFMTALESELVRVASAPYFFQPECVSCCVFACA